MPHIATARMISGGTTAPVDRTTPDSTKVMPKKMNEPMAMRFRWRAASSAALPSGRNQPRVCRSASSTRATSTPVIPRLHSTPARAVPLTRSHRPAPTFCAAMVAQAAPIAMAGICTYVHSCSAAP